eukprot:67872_1
MAIFVSFLICMGLKTFLAKQMNTVFFGFELTQWIILTFWRINCRRSEIIQTFELNGICELNNGSIHLYFKHVFSYIISYGKTLCGWNGSILNMTSINVNRMMMKAQRNTNGRL